MLAVAPVPTLTRPATRPRSRWIASRASSSTLKARPACSRSTAPASVGEARRPRRFRSGTPTTRSRCRTWWLIAGWLRCRLSPAREKLPERAIAWSVLTCTGLRSIIVSRTLREPSISNRIDSYNSFYESKWRRHTLWHDRGDRPHRRAGRRRVDRRDLQPGHRGSPGDARDGDALGRGAQAVARRARRPPPGARGRGRRPRRGLGQPELVQPPPRLRPRRGLLGLRGPRLAGARRRPSAAGGLDRARARARLPQAGPGRLPLQRGRRRALSTARIRGRRRLSRAGPAGRQMGRRRRDGADPVTHPDRWAVWLNEEHADFLVRDRLEEPVGRRPIGIWSRRCAGRIGPRGCA